MAKKIADESAALLRNVIENPDDDPPRLVYADWLQERGDDDRAEFIRVQVEAHGCADEARRSELEKRAAELLRAHREWYKEVQAWAREYARFRRGFVAEVSGTARQLLSGIKGVLKRAPVTTLDIRIPFPQEAATTFAGMPELEAIRDLSLPSSALKTRLLPFLDSPLCHNLRSLSAYLREPAAVALADSPGMSELRSLTSGGVAVNSGGLSALAKSPHLGNLRELHFHGCSLGGVSDLAASPIFERLTDLTLWASAIAADVDHLTAAKRVNLKRLNLGLNHSLGDGAAQALAGWPGLSGVEHLNLAKGGITHAGISALAESPHAGSLRELVLDFNAVGSAGLASLCRSKTLTQLVRLNLWQCDISHEALSNFNTRKGLPSLRLVRYGYNGMNEAGIKRASETLGPLFTERN